MKCPFCDKKVLDKQKIWENNSFYILNNIDPITPTHHLLITKEHMRSIYNFTPEMYLDLFTAVQKIKDLFGDRMLWVNAVKDQSVPHWHMHLVDPVWGVHGVDSALRCQLSKSNSKKNAIKRFLNGI